MYGKKTYRKNKKTSKVVRKPKRKIRKTVNVNKALQPFSQRYIVRMKYSDNFLLSTANTPWVFNLNSINKPNFTGTGHQPLGHDQLNVLYNRYRVYAVKWHLRAIPTDGSNQYICAVPTNESFTPVSFDDVREKPRSKYILQALNDTSKVLSGKVSLPSLTGRTKSQYMADDRYQAQFGFDPAESMTLRIFSYNAGLLTTASVGTRVTIELTYYVECFDPNTLSQS